MYNSENFSAPTKATSRRPAYSPALYQIKSAIAKLLVSFRLHHLESSIVSEHPYGSREPPVLTRTYGNRPDGVTTGHQWNATDTILYPRPSNNQAPVTAQD